MCLRHAWSDGQAGLLVLFLSPQAGSHHLCLMPGVSAASNCLQGVFHTPAIYLPLPATRQGRQKRVIVISILLRLKKVKQLAQGDPTGIKLQVFGF